jgi:hypothetical protein
MGGSILTHKFETRKHLCITQAPNECALIMRLARRREVQIFQYANNYEKDRKA